MVSPVLEEIDGEMSNKVRIMKLNVDENQEITRAFGVMSIPTLILFKDEVAVDKVIGFQPKEALIELISKNA